MLFSKSRKSSKIIEICYYIISELLKNDFDIYTPITDIEGIDFIIKDKEGGYVEVQVKSRTVREGQEQFVITESKRDAWRYNFFIVCHNIKTGDFYVIPSLIFYSEGKKKTQKGKSKRFMTFSQIKKYEQFKNKKGIESLKMALKDSMNRLFSSH